jgi:hypothetical protein
MPGTVPMPFADPHSSTAPGGFGPWLLLLVGLAIAAMMSDLAWGNHTSDINDTEEAPDVVDANMTKVFGGSKAKAKDRSLIIKKERLLAEIEERYAKKRKNAADRLDIDRKDSKLKAAIDQRRTAVQEIDVELTAIASDESTSDQVAVENIRYQNQN